MIVPEKTIVCIPVIPGNGLKEFNMDFSSFLIPLNSDHKRDWFTPHFYKCLPLSIGNMQGFAFKSPFEFDVVWNGSSRPEDLQIIVNDNTVIEKDTNHVSVSSEFGHGIFTIHFPLILKTPPGVNLMTIAPPNYPVPGISPMTGVVETDNLRFTFTLNFKVDLVDTVIRITKDYPIMGILPIPRYFCDSFTLVNAYDVLDKDIIEEERQVVEEHNIRRIYQTKNNKDSDRIYYTGTDIRGNKFKDHQLPRKKK
jgi:hypothetical protein